MLTPNVLLQIIIEQEENGPSLLTIESLQKWIRLYSIGPMQEMLAPMFEQAMTFFYKQQNLLKESKFENDPVRFMSDLTQKNMANWQQLQQQWLQLFLNPQNKQSTNPNDNKEETEDIKPKSPSR